MTQGQYERAESLFQRAVSIREEVPGKTLPELADSINNLANLYVERGAYDRAEPLFQRALVIQEATLGKDHLDVANSLNSIAGLARW